MRRSADGTDGAGWPITLESPSVGIQADNRVVEIEPACHERIPEFVHGFFDGEHNAGPRDRRSSRSSALRSAGDRTFRSTSESIGWSTSTSTPTAAQSSDQPMAAQQYSDAWEMDPTIPAGQIGARCGVARIWRGGRSEKSHGVAGAAAPPSKLDPASIDRGADESGLAEKQRLRRR